MTKTARNAVPVDSAQYIATSSGKTIRIILPVYKPDPGFLDDQLSSLQDQIGCRLCLHIVIADRTSLELVEEAVTKTGLAPEIHVPANELNSVDAFEYGLNEALKASQPDDLFALCDQDDIWDPDKLQLSAKHLASVEGCTLVHTDARLIDGKGRQTDPSIFRTEARMKTSDLRSLLYLNNITGMTALMTRDVIQAALPFPKQAGLFFHHDLWLGLVAGAMGQVAFLNKATVSYRQHHNNTVGLARTKQGGKRSWKDWLIAKFAEYSLAAFLAKSLFLRCEELLKSDPASVSRKNLDRLKPYLSQYGTGTAFFLDALKLSARAKRQQASIALDRGIVKSGRLVWAAMKAVRLDLNGRLEQFDQIGFSVAPGVAPSYSTPPASAQAAPAKQARPWQSFIDQRRVAEWSVDVQAAMEPGFVILVPTLNPTEIFAGIETALDLGVMLAKQGARVQFIATDLPIHSRAASEAYILSKFHPDDVVEPDTIAISCGPSSDSIAFSPQDQILATAWWTATVARSILKTPDMVTTRFLYLIQDFEPNFYPWGTEYAGAMETYAYDFIPIFNTVILRDFFHFNGIIPDRGDALVFRPSIDLDVYASATRAPQATRRRIAVYGRPEVPRNMFPLCVESLSTFITEQGITPDQAEFVSVGLSHDPVALPGGNTLLSMGKIPMADYPEFLTTVDIGLSLMLSPHPSHPPLEWAASGVRVVTNRYSVKNLSDLSGAIYSAQPDADALAACLEQAWADARTPVPPEQRHVDMSSLGQSLGDVADALLSSTRQVAYRKAG